MPRYTLAGPTAKYLGKTKGWEHRRGKMRTVVKNTHTASETYPVMFEGEDKVVQVQYENLDFVKKLSEDIEYVRSNASNKELQPA